MADLSPYQQKIVKRYYDNYDALASQRLAELVGDLYMAEGKKRDKLWARAGELLTKLEFPPARVTHLLEKRDPALLAAVMKELEGKGK